MERTPGFVDGCHSSTRSHAQKCVTKLCATLSCKIKHSSYMLQQQHYKASMHRERRPQSIAPGGGGCQCSVDSRVFRVLGVLEMMKEPCNTTMGCKQPCWHEAG